VEIRFLRVCGVNSWFSFFQSQDGLLLIVSIVRTGHQFWTFDSERLFRSKPPHQWLGLCSSLAQEEWDRGGNLTN
jgi:hypothetical protein